MWKSLGSSTHLGCMRSLSLRGWGFVLEQMVPTHSPPSVPNCSRSVLASQLLASSDYECGRALGTMELLKLRFGEPAMHSCEVRGMQQSEREWDTEAGKGNE